MAEEKRYFWLKLKDDFFDSKRIKKLRKIAGGDTYTIIYLKMQLLALKTGGILEYTGLENSFTEELALDLVEDPENVAVTVNYLLSCGLLETSDNIEYFVPYVALNTGSEGASAKRVREYRMRKKENEMYQIQNAENGQIPEKCTDIVTSSRECNADVTQASRRVRDRVRERDRDRVRDISSTEETIVSSSEDICEEPEKIKNENQVERAESIPYKEVQTLYNTTCSSLERCTRLSDARRKAIKARFSSGYKLEDFKRAFEIVASNQFLLGNNKKNWRASFDWIIKDSSMAKILDGYYEDRTKNSWQQSSGAETSNIFLEMLNERRNGQ